MKVKRMIAAATESAMRPQRTMLTVFIVDNEDDFADALGWFSRSFPSFDNSFAFARVSPKIYKVISSQIQAIPKQMYHANLLHGLVAPGAGYRSCVSGLIHD